MLIKVKAEEILEFIRNGEDCKMEIHGDGNAFILLKNTNKTLDKISRSKCNKDWENFLKRYENYKLAA